MNYFQRYLAEEFAEDYSEGRLSRREALKLIAKVTGSVLVANSILAACAPPPDETPAGPGATTGAPAPGSTEAPAPTGAPGSTEAPAPTGVPASTEAPAPTGTASTTEIPVTGTPCPWRSRMAAPTGPTAYRL